VNGTAQSLTANGGTIGWGGNVSEAFSTESIPGDGYIESTINSNPVLSRNVGVGLSYADVAGHPLLSIDYCLWQAWSGQKFIVYVNGAAVHTVPGSFAAGDVARVERVGSTIHFKVNGVSVFDTTEFSSGALHADMTINRTGHLITGLTLMTGPPQRVADVRSYSDYYPYGWAMVGRQSNLTDYRFGMNGMEMNNEVSGDGNSYTTFFRQYDPRLGRWMSIDPIVHPWLSPYNAFDANPIYYADPSGADGKGGTTFNNSTSGNYVPEQGGGRSHVASDGNLHSSPGLGYQDSDWGPGGGVELPELQVSDSRTDPLVVKSEPVPQDNTSVHDVVIPIQNSPSQDASSEFWNLGLRTNDALKGEDKNLNTKHHGDQITGDEGMPESEVESMRGRPDGQTSDIVPGATAGGSKGASSKAEKVKRGGEAVRPLAEEAEPLLRGGDSEDVQEKVDKRRREINHELGEWQATSDSNRITRKYGPGWITLDVETGETDTNTLHPDSEYRKNK